MLAQHTNSSISRIHAEEEYLVFLRDFSGNLVTFSNSCEGIAVDAG